MNSYYGVCMTNVWRSMRWRDVPAAIARRPILTCGVSTAYVRRNHCLLHFLNTMDCFYSCQNSRRVSMPPYKPRETSARGIGKQSAPRTKCMCRMCLRYKMPQCQRFLNARFNGLAVPSVLFGYPWPDSV